MNIIMATWSYWPSKDGVQMVTQYEAEGLTKLGHQVTILTQHKSGMSREEEHNGVHIVRFKHRLRLRIPVGEKKEFQAYLREHIAECDAFVSICAQSFTYMWSKPLLRDMHCRKVVYMHGARDEHINFKKLHDWKHLPKEMLLTPYWNLWFKRNWKSLCQYDAAVHLFENDGSYRYFTEHGFRNNYVLVNACEPELFETPDPAAIAAVKQRYGISGEYFLQVANMCLRKNQIEAVRAFYEAGAGGELVLIAAEDNDYSVQVQALVDSFPTDVKTRIHILTGISREDTRELIRGSTTTLLTSQNEYLPVTIIEGMAAGVPFLASNVGSVPMLPGGVIYHDFSELCYWMRYFSAHADFCQSMGAIARGYADEHMRTETAVARLELILTGKI